MLFCFVLFLCVCVFCFVLFFISSTPLAPRQDPGGLEVESKIQDIGLWTGDQAGHEVGLLTLRKEVCVGSSFELHSTWSKGGG